MPGFDMTLEPASLNNVVVRVRESVRAPSNERCWWVDISHVDDEGVSSELIAGPSHEDCIPVIPIFADPIPEPPFVSQVSVALVVLAVIVQFRKRSSARSTTR